MGTDTASPGGSAPGASARPPGGSDDRLISLPGRSPVLDAAQLGVLRGYGSERDVAAGDVLFADGDETYDLIVLLAGTADIIEGYGQPGASVVRSYGPSKFLGEIGMLTGQRAFLSAVATSAGRVLAVPVAQLRRVMAQEPSLSDLILRTFLLRRSILMSRGTGLTLIGSRFDPDTRRLLEVLARNRLVWIWLDLEASPDAEQILQGLDVPVTDLPIIIVPGGPVLRNPGSRALLDTLGISGDASSSPPGVSDLLVVGAGPAGLAAAVYGASDGMATTLAEDTALGGQAGTSSRIENYLGFPAGLSGEELAARGALQAQKFGVRIKLAAKAAALSFEDGVHQVTFDDGEAIQARSVIIATGAQYNRLPLDRLAEFEGVGVYYAATQAEAQACGTGPVAIVGGGNSAGQAALFLSRLCATVHVIIRRATLDASMSRYLVARIERNPGIVVWPSTQVTALTGTNRLESVRLRRQGEPDESELGVTGLFVFIGAKPGTGWLAGQLAEDRHGFLLTGTDIPATQLEDKNLTPLFLETSRPGIFAVGDVRSGSVKRVAAAIGEGSVAVRLAFERLQSEGTADPTGLAAPTPAHFNAAQTGRTTQMPMIDVYATAGTFTDKHQLATDLAATLMAIEAVPDIPMFRQNTAAFVHDMPAGDLSNVDGASNYVRVQVLTNAGALDRGKQIAVVSQFTSMIADAAHDPALAGRTWVLLTEAVPGGWGLGGHANTNEELVAAARKQIAALRQGG